MTTRIAHISDLHFPAADAAQVEALRRAIDDAAPDAVVVTGDVTRRGRRTEFRLVVDFIQSLPGRKLVVPGNHDIPLSAMVSRKEMPFARFRRYFGETLTRALVTPDAVILGLNTAAAARATLDWSLGHARRDRIAETAERLAEIPAGTLRVVACHHPLLPQTRDPQRSRTRHGRDAFSRLAAAGLDVLLHGHLHNSVACREVWQDRSVKIIGANTALSERERGGGSGFNIIDLAGGEAEVHPHVWDENGHYRAM